MMTLLSSTGNIISCIPVNLNCHNKNPRFYGEASLLALLPLNFYRLETKREVLHGKLC